MKIYEGSRCPEQAISMKATFEHADGVEEIEGYFLTEEHYRRLLEEIQARKDFARSLDQDDNVGINCAGKWLQKLGVTIW